MKPIFIILFSFVIFGISYSQPNGYVHKIDVEIEGLSETQCMLAYHLGNKQYVKDTIMLDTFGKGSFVGQDSLPTGIYMIMIPELDQNYFEFVVHEQQFSLKSNSIGLNEYVETQGSVENELMLSDQKVSQNASVRIQLAQEKLKSAATSTEKQALETEIETILEEVKTHRLQLINDHPGLFYPKVVKALMDIDLPEPPLNIDGTTDETFMVRYIQEHFFDHIDFSEDGLVRSPIVDRKVDEYLKYFTHQQPDSINQSVDFILEKANANEVVFKSLLIKLLNQFATSEIMGQDAVYVHIVDTYYASGRATWMDQAELIRIRQRSATTKPLLIGKTAPNLELKNHKGELTSLHGVQSKFTVLYFWNPDCGHCKTETPKLAEGYPALQKRGVEVFAANTDMEEDKWIEFIETHQLNWINVADLDIKSTFREVYDVRKTPLVFILDEDKKIIAKYIGVDQIESIIDIYQANESTPR